MTNPKRIWTFRVACLAPAVLVAVGAGAAFGQGVETSTAASSLDGQLDDFIDEVVVTAARRPQSLVPDPTATKTTLAAERIERARALGTDAAALVDTVAGVRVLDLGGPVSERRLTIRGGSPAQSLVLIDGVRIDDPYASGLGLGLADLESVESIEVVRGGAGAVLGDGALTGALSVTTRAPTRAPLESAALTYGSFGTVRLSAATMARSFSLSGTVERTNGDFDYVSSIFGLEDVPKVRRNNTARRGAISLRTEHGVNKSTLSFMGGAVVREAGVPGLETQENLSASEERKSLRAKASWRHPLSTSARASEVAVAASVAYLDIDYADPPKQELLETSFIVLSSEARLSLALGDHQLAKAQVSFSGERTESRISYRTPNRSRLAAVISDEIFIGPLTVFAAGRVLTVTDQDTALLPRVGGRLELSDELAVRLAVGRSFRAPTIDQLHHPPEAGFVGNEDLRAETAWEAELALSYDTRRLRTTFSIFGRRISDPILYLLRDAFRVRPENVGDANAVGGELELFWQQRFGAFRLWNDAGFGLLLSRLEETGEPLPTQPVWNASTELGIGVPLLDLSTSARAVGPTSVSYGPAIDEGLRVPTYFRWDAALTARPLDQVTLALRVLNLLDRRNLQSVHKFPLPGRTFFLSLRVTTEGASS